MKIPQLARVIPDYHKDILAKLQVFFSNQNPSCQKGKSYDRSKSRKRKRDYQRRQLEDHDPQR
jgi:hypothetical protein